MYYLSVKRHFEAAHFLRGYKGKCENLHGHRYEAALKVRVSKLDECGMGVDFKLLKTSLSEVLQSYDHTCLNDLTPFDSQNPSAENIAKDIYNRLKPVITKNGAELYGVEVWESPDSSVLYQPD
ncbi:6-pyruvoyl tetrahydrobiopterin synthase [Dehalococcoides mccartyi]|jgi:6-pyruvoyltetrahydropterin/6-carboxytetrahydropterin synthase|uniref:6-carboxytetrahydropterin synthase QueD n=1 Tax=Dehalococcoides TaxID=61434 RepID=UPI0004E0A21A|nr:MULTISPECIES: 6-carboxytetrahydropterin synthase QueD [Dehalococcoides]AII58606.1 6-pyruvoyl tetrahydrobiopterin synthase [Dehalococcoides mccartyi CG1]APH11722.1 6-pyruvoyl tetrahydrobiopterin synthase [Dehalococcoides mccartyi]QYY58676.1 6-carboxytetrahydropterin synthase QueD [Dehalococcoides mccartyi]BAQ35432.1 6-carboxy-5,6,7,8-tetrahydropterin synthase [Dehalococcoides sp. UCH007]